MGLTVHGGDNAPYLWVKTPQDKLSWEFFDQLLEQCQVIATPAAASARRVSTISASVRSATGRIF